MGAKAYYLDGSSLPLEEDGVRLKITRTNYNMVMARILGEVPFHNYNAMGVGVNGIMLRAMATCFLDNLDGLLGQFLRDLHKRYQDTGTYYFDPE